MFARGLSVMNVERVRDKQFFLGFERKKGESPFSFEVHFSSSNILFLAKW